MILGTVFALVGFFTTVSIAVLLATMFSVFLKTPVHLVVQMEMYVCMKQQGSTQKITESCPSWWKPTKELHLLVFPLFWFEQKHNICLCHLSKMTADCTAFYPTPSSHWESNGKQDIRKNNFPAGSHLSWGSCPTFPSCKILMSAVALMMER